MKVMGIETSTSKGGVAIVGSGGLRVKYSWNMVNTHSEEIFFSIDKVLKQAKISLKKIDGFAVSLGPGSFTGIRIGVTITRTLAQVLDKLVVGIPTLDSLAYNVLPSNMPEGLRYFISQSETAEDEWQKYITKCNYQSRVYKSVVKGGTSDYLICSMVDALRNEVYTALYVYNMKKNRCFQRLTNHCVLSIDDLLDNFISPYISNFTNIIFVGPAISLHHDLIKKKLSNKAIMAPLNKIFPEADNLAELGMQFFAGNKGQKWNKIFPFYIRQARTELTSNKKFRIKFS